MFSGLFASQHGLYQPYVGTSINENTPLLSELFNNKGFLTLGSSSGRRLNPKVGFARNFDRHCFLYFSLKPEAAS
jgi:hypothetical protein|tara:strand:+ start:539 stop:763 length:225 start_codon:yes stop_codon:yes gene_type:complete